MAIKDNLKRIRESKGLTQAQVAKALDITRPAVTQWESGWSVPKMGHIEKLAELYGVSKSEILGERGGMPSRFVPVPLHGRVAAGTPIEMLPADEMKEAPARFVDDDPQAFLVRVVGDSMSRQIHDGNFALVSPKYTEPNDRDMFLVTVNGDDATIKRIRKLANGVELLPDSYDPTYRPQVYDFGEADTPPVRVLGKVVWWCREF